MTKDDIKQRIQQENIKFLRLQFTDILGHLKSLFISVSQLDKALDNRCGFDGSSIEGFVRIEESDMRLHPSPDSFRILPLEQDGGKEARMICDVHYTDGTPFMGDPRQVLHRMLGKARDMGFEMNIGAECEFFLFALDETGQPTMQAVDSAGYFDLDPVDRGARARKEMCAVLEEMGFEIEAAHHENARGQHEIDFMYSGAVDAADSVMALKETIKVVANKHNMHATFMPKPIYGTAGSGMHTNISLWKDGKNAFVDESDAMGLSKTAYAFIAGLLERCPGLTAVTNPLVNSYKRLVSGYEAPVNIAWSARNRSPLVRIPSATGASTRIELRSPDPSCNPYLAFAVALGAGLDGIERGLTPPPSVDTNIYAMDEQERKAHQIGLLPQSLYEALQELAADAVLRNALGEHVYERYYQAKMLEYNEYAHRVHAWETEQYLHY